MVEFREASSQYVIDHKEDSAEISSNAEFEKADKMQTFKEDDIEVLKIEKSKDWRKKTGMNMMRTPISIFEEAQLLKEQGVKSTRTKGFKHFNQVGYMGQDYKEVPRWAVSKDGLNKVIAHQQKIPNLSQQVFGRLKPAQVQEHFVLSKIFSKGEDARSYMDERGESADWNDQSEFATPFLTRSRELGDLDASANDLQIRRQRQGFAPHFARSEQKPNVSQT